MSSEIAINVKNLGKCYQVYTKPIDRLKQFLMPQLQSFLGQNAIPYYKEFWALKNVNFEVKKGETVGIIGRNGSGKSTLLQIICGTLNPTTGSVETRGRIAALLELGSGFNPEFTGRENIYMNGLILGLNLKEIQDRFAMIEEFADIGDFINQPIKTYSSGMLLRLAFAVQVSLQPDILVIDEALAVGDGGFQLKCMLRMLDLQSKGTTILLVSHDTSSVIRLCNRVILFDQGSIKTDSLDALMVIKQYETITRNVPIQKNQPIINFQKNLKSKNQTYLSELGGIHETRLGTRMAEYLEFKFLDTRGNEKSVFESGEEINIRAVIRSHADFPRVVSGFTLKSIKGIDIWGDNTIFGEIDFSLSRGLFYINYEFKLALPTGEYFLYAGLADISNERIELDQRWPVRKVVVIGQRQCLGYVYSPANITYGVEFDDRFG